ncbi:NAD-dependent epimerase/dehydratase family protein [Leptospira langatensis]|uniref:NAD-dependent epimerase/dehydratase family protein n=1 Tax=Leptospira langatensis TaxID=2484983 RepID=A0A5F1ZQL6_9LEPT|nr:NmrA family NAD(P)-binding protein [Leptospira langatensis]TGK05186.1 NAD-dependent epimerase/dehydratase family protein [Leptospira langatensis]TGL38322.1 NAD-dependent epimerase/dehydratase family protein [Leptospira langatensis]
MGKPKILVTGATGRTGAIVLKELQDAGYPVRAMVRTEDTRTRLLRAQGVEIAVADMCDPEAVAAALQGVQRAYYLPPVDPAMLQGATVFATAAKEARLEHIVLMTQWLSSPTHPSLSTRHHWLIDRIFRMIPEIGLTIVNPGFFADIPYLSALAPAVYFGIFPWPFGKGLNAPPSVDDIGRVAAAALMDPSRHAGQIYRPTGPELLSGQDMAATLSRFLGRKVKLAPTPPEIFLKAARLEGNPISVVSVMKNYIEDARRGAFQVGAPTDHVRRVTGRDPETFEMVARRYAALPRFNRSPLNYLKEIFQFAITPFVPLPFSRYEAGLGISRPAKPKFSIDSQIWLAEHSNVKS